MAGDLHSAGNSTPELRRDVETAVDLSQPSLPARAVEKATRPRGSLRKMMFAAIAVAALVGAGYGAHYYWTVGRFRISTDDAYVTADITTISPKVSGYIKGVLVEDNEPAAAGRVLAFLDDRDFRAALDQARADVEAARAAVASKQAELEVQQAAIVAARAAVEVDKADATFAEQENARYSNLARSGYGTVRNAQEASAKIRAARAAVDRDTASLDMAHRQVALIKTQLQQAQAALARTEAAQQQADLNLSYTVIRAPSAGVVANRTLRVGQYVQAGTPLMAVVPLDAAYIVANFKETQLTDVRPGQKVKVEVDMFPSTTIEGRVDSIAPASGQEFALLPPDNATGNFTKVVQRVPVKVVFDAGNELAGSLRPGMSVVPTIDTKVPASTAVAAAP